MKIWVLRLTSGRHRKVKWERPFSSEKRGFDAAHTYIKRNGRNGRWRVFGRTKNAKDGFTWEDMSGPNLDLDCDLLSVHQLEMDFDE